MLNKEKKVQPTSKSGNDAKPIVMRRFYWLRRFRFARKKIGGAWIKTAYRGWITYQLYCDYNAYGFDPVALASEEDGVLEEDGRAVKRFYTQHSKGVTVRPASEIFQPKIIK